jgi:hypothetical protein
MGAMIPGNQATPLNPHQSIDYQNFLAFAE